ncbi:MAG: cyclodeaminase/cyclohydrolase family protein [Chloroflexi bacterium]|nr:cyclodeaminase/cyclohydrolase family protein [Chloroflexota bacterium]
MRTTSEVALLDRPVREFLDQLASSAPAPGGGAAAALAGALGAALVAMTANLTLGRERFKSIEPQARALQVEADGLRGQLEAYVELDVAAFAEVSAAYRLPRSSDAERGSRDQAIQQALAGAAEVPLETARVCRRVLDVCQTAAPLLNPAVVSDVMVGATLAYSALQGAAINVEVNLAGMSDGPTRTRLASELAAVREGASARLDDILAAARSRLAPIG